MPPTLPAQHDSLEKFLTFQREVNRLFRRIFEEGTAGRALPGEALQARANVSEIGDELRVEVETPGTPADRLSLWVSRDLIVVEGEKPFPSRAPREGLREEAKPAGRRAVAGEGRVTYHCMERDFGSFRRVLEIPCPVDTNGIRATYAAGLLTIVLPKIEDRRGERRKVEIEVRKESTRA